MKEGRKENETEVTTGFCGACTHSLALSGNLHVQNLSCTHAERKKKSNDVLVGDSAHPAIKRKSQII